GVVPRFLANDLSHRGAVRDLPASRTPQRHGGFRPPRQSRVCPLIATRFDSFLRRPLSHSLFDRPSWPGPDPCGRLVGVAIAPRTAHFRSPHPPASPSLVSSPPSSLPAHPPSSEASCTNCVEGGQHATPHSFSFPLTTAPLQTQNMDVWGSAPVPRLCREFYFMFVEEDYSRYTTVFPLERYADVPNTLIPWLVAAHSQRAQHVLRRHSDHGGKFAFSRLGRFCRAEGITKMCCRPSSGLGPLVLRMGFVFGTSCADKLSAREPRADKLSACTLPCVLLGFLLDTPDWRFYHPSSHHFFHLCHVTFDESVCFYTPFPHRNTPIPPPPLFLNPIPLLASMPPPIPPFLLVSAPARPLSVRGAPAIGSDVLEDRHFVLAFLAVAAPHPYAMLLAPEGEPNALDMQASRTYAEAVLGPWAFQWIAAMDAEMASCLSKRTYVDVVSPHGANIVDGMWISR
ncbi:unnamed protein product, partial [Closterium sp. NIES-53]